MLLPPGTEVTLLRPPSADELTSRQRRELSEALAAAISSWPGAGLMGMQLRRVAVLSSADLPSVSGAVAWRSEPPAVTASLAAPLAASLVCLEVGGQPDDGTGPLTGVDMAILDTWARRALDVVMRRLGLEIDEVLRSDSPAEMSPAPSPELALVAEIDSAAGDALVAADWKLVAGAQAGDGSRLGDRRGLFDDVRVEVEARMTGASVPLTDLLAATEGDVVLLGTGADRQVELMVAGVSVARGRPGVKSGMMAVKISSTDAS
ncbi:MAG: FliM/FliN family flagellar motor switch protein [Armatimonadetes bacterium]|nr:FliM/FliN family flagellar motor switch protein [Armatimonadota bacterium]